MKTIKIQLEYKCFPVWIYKDNGCVDDTIMPPELANDAELQSRFDAIQDRFDATYIDNEIEFANKGFGSDEAESQFYRDLNEAVDELEAKCAGIYTVERRYGSY